VSSRRRSGREGSEHHLQLLLREGSAELRRIEQVVGGVALPRGPVAVRLIGLAHARLLAGDLDGAERLLQESQTLLREAGSWWSYGSTFSYLALLALLRGRPDECIRLALEGIARLQPMRDSFDLVFTLVYPPAPASKKRPISWRHGCSAPSTRS
jgi:hypothetical protein